MIRLWFLVAMVSVGMLASLACGSGTAPAEEAPNTAGPAAAADAAPGVAMFPDETFEAAIRSKLRKPEGPILISELEAFTDFDLSSQLNVADISGLEHFVNVTKLHFATNEISDISPLASLSNLTWLNLAQNHIVDITPLASLSNLTWLSFEQNEIVDITPLASLTNLTALSLRQNEVIDISPLASLTNLTELNLTNNHISDLSPLASLGNITILTLVNNEITDLSPLLEAGWSEGVEIRLWGEPLDTNSIEVVIPQLEAAGVKIQF